MLFINFTNSQIDLARKIGGKIVDCSNIEGTNCYCEADSERKIKEKISEYIEQSNIETIDDQSENDNQTNNDKLTENCNQSIEGKLESHCPTEIRNFDNIHFIDSGDYHYMTKIFTDNITTNFNLLLFDHHPDMQQPAFGNILSCGGWVSNMLEKNKYLQKVIILGINPKLLDETRQYGNRVIVLNKDDIENIKAENLTKVTSEIISSNRLDSSIYISIDKDVMNTEISRTNWDQGNMSLNILETLLSSFTRGRKVLGVDICGCFPRSKGGEDEDFLINENTDIEILKIVEKLV